MALKGFNGQPPSPLKGGGDYGVQKTPESKKRGQKLYKKFIWVFLR
jgi:hypothetical protein